MVRANEKIKHIQNEVNDARTAELLLTNQLGIVRAELAVEKSRNKAAENTISELKRDLEITKTDISLSQSALQVNFKENIKEPTFRHFRQRGS